MSRDGRSRRYGRSAVESMFEQHVADVLGIRLELAQALTRSARTRIGPRSHRVRAAAFVFATTFPGRSVFPAVMRQRAIRAFLNATLAEPHDAFLYLGVSSPSERPCSGLLSG